MNKKKILATTLAGVIALNTLASGCARKNSTSAESVTNSKSISYEELTEFKLVTERYIVDKIPASANIRYHGEKEVIEYYLNESVKKLGFVLIGDMGIKVEHVHVYTYKPLQTYNNDGTITYVAIYGGIIDKNIVYLTDSKILSKDEVIEYFKNHTYENGEPKLSLHM